MRALSRLVAKEVARRMARRETTRSLLVFAPLIPLLLALLAIVSVTLIVLIVVAGQNGGGCGTTVPVGTAGGNVKTEADTVHYFESEGITPNGSAGVTGNLEQENHLSSSGDGVAQWTGARKAEMIAYVQGRGLDPKTLGGQLTFIVYDLRTKYAALLAELNSAPDPGTAATMFETVYELCSGVTGYLQVMAGSLCNDPARRQFAVAALAAAAGSGTSVPVSLTTGGGCVAGYGGYVSPVSKVVGLSASRIDMGVDYSTTSPSPILAVGDGQIVNTDAHGWPGLSFIEERLSGGRFAGRCWYAAEKIMPTVSQGQSVHAGEQIGILFPGYPSSEFGWSTCAGGTTLAASLHEQAPGKDPGAWSSAAGASASRFLVALSAPPGAMSAGGPHGPLPVGYP